MSTYLPNRAGQQAAEVDELKKIRRAAIEVSRTWHELMTGDSDDMDPVVEAIGALREALGDGAAGHGGADRRPPRRRRSARRRPSATEGTSLYGRTND